MPIEASTYDLSHVECLKCPTWVGLSIYSGYLRLSPSALYLYGLGSKLQVIETIDDQKLSHPVTQPPSHSAANIQHDRWAGEQHIYCL